MPRLTKRLIEAAEVKSADYFIHDDELPGFAARILPSGRKVFTLQYRAGIKTRRFTIGPFGVLTPEQARTKATQILAAVRNGEDPVGQKKAHNMAPTVRDLSIRYLKEHCAHHVKPSTRRNYEYILNAYILPQIGHIKVVDLVRADITNLHQAMSKYQTNANRMLEIVSKMFNLAEMWGWRAEGANPRKHIKKFKENKRERYLSPVELKRLGVTLRMAEGARLISPYAIAAFRLLILTGARLGEIQTCKWDYVHLDRAIIRLPDSKTGPRLLHLGRTAVELLRHLPRQPNNPYLICSATVPGAHIHDLQSAWQQIRKWAELEDVRIHDLRHTFASSAVATGMSLPIIGRMLGHTQTQTTARYAHLAIDPVVKAANEVTGKLGEWLALPVPGENSNVEILPSVAGAKPAQLLTQMNVIDIADAPRFMDSDTAAKYLGVAPRLMENWRWRKTGPRFIKIGNRIRYTQANLDEYIGLRKSA